MIRSRRDGPKFTAHLAWISLSLCLSTLAPVWLLGVTVNARVIVTGPEDKPSRSPTVLWLTPVSDSAATTPPTDPPAKPFRLLQKDKRFIPHMLVVSMGATVEFPNRDPFFHNVFSLYKGKRFDLGLYESGSTRSVRFDRPGISYIFCNIHPEMSAVVVVLKTPYYGLSNAQGEIKLLNVPRGRYRVEAWQEAALPEDLQKLSREVTISAEPTSLGVFHIRGTGRSMVGHKNKYGRDYDEPVSPNPLYDQP